MGDFLSLGILSSVFYPILASGAIISERSELLRVLLERRMRPVSR
jgi:hypothetical protein